MTTTPTTVREAQRWTIQCPDCDFSHHNPGCHRCWGRGLVAVVVYTATCDLCHGTGLLLGEHLDTMSCPACEHGRRYTTETEALS